MQVRDSERDATFGTLSVAVVDVLLQALARKDVAALRDDAIIAAFIADRANHHSTHCCHLLLQLHQFFLIPSSFPRLL